ncbi:MAG: hypothetical protein NVS3B21_12060 [Acidimicrobiales bacterium]
MPGGRGLTGIGSRSSAWASEPPLLGTGRRERHRRRTISTIPATAAIHTTTIASPIHHGIVVGIGRSASAARPAGKAGAARPAGNMGDIVTHRGNAPGA